MPVVVEDLEVVVDPPPTQDVSAPQASPALDAKAAAHAMQQLAIAHERAQRLRAD